MGPADFEVAVSSENSHYLAWQTLAFCYSCLSRLGIAPTVVVHATDIPLRPEFHEIAAWGCRIIEAPSFRAHPVGDFPPRNEPGSLVTLGQAGGFTKPFVLFCEADMLFTGVLIYPQAICCEHYNYLDYRSPRVSKVAKELNLVVDEDELNIKYGLGVPYLLPAEAITPLAGAWIEILNMFEQLEWIDIMYAFGLALASQGYHPIPTRLMTDNLDEIIRTKTSIIHYCYGTSNWDKRFFKAIKSPLDQEKFNGAASARDITREIKHQMAEAQGFRASSRWLRDLRINAWKLRAKLQFQIRGMIDGV